MNELFDQMQKLMQNITFDLFKCTKGNKSAAQRVRVNTIAFEKIAKEFRQKSVKKNNLDLLDEDA